MGIEYLGLSSINGPLVILEGVQDAFFDEIVEFTVDGKTKKIGRIIELYEDKAVIQVFEGTENMSLDNTRTKLTGHPMEVSLAPDMLGRTFNGTNRWIRTTDHRCQTRCQRPSIKSGPQKISKKLYPYRYFSN